VHPLHPPAIPILETRPFLLLLLLLCSGSGPGGPRGKRGRGHRADLGGPLPADAERSPNLFCCFFFFFLLLGLIPVLVLVRPSPIPGGAGDTSMGTTRLDLAVRYPRALGRSGGGSGGRGRRFWVGFVFVFVFFFVFVFVFVFFFFFWLGSVRFGGRSGDGDGAVGRSYARKGFSLGG
jgi:hypothetical protein